MERISRNCKFKPKANNIMNVPLELNGIKIRHESKEDRKSSITILIRRTEMLSFLFIVLFLAVSPAVFAQKDLIGKWQSNSISVGTESMKMELMFKDSVHMEMAFITDNRIPNVGRCLSRMSIQATYQFVGPYFLTEIEHSTLATKILNLELSDEMKKKTPPSMIPSLKASLNKQMKQTAVALFAGYDGGSMIYVSHKDTDDVFSFIIGDENNAMDMEFTRMKK